MIIGLTAGKCLRFLIGEKNHQSFLVEIRNYRFLMADRKDYLAENVWTLFYLLCYNFFIIFCIQNTAAVRDCDLQ